MWPHTRTTRISIASWCSSHPKKERNFSIKFNAKITDTSMENTYHRGCNHEHPPPNPRRPRHRAHTPQHTIHRRRCRQNTRKIMAIRTSPSRHLHPQIQTLHTTRICPVADEGEKLIIIPAMDTFRRATGCHTAHSNQQGGIDTPRRHRIEPQPVTGRHPHRYNEAKCPNCGAIAYTVTSNGQEPKQVETCNFCLCHINPVQFGKGIR